MGGTGPAKKRWVESAELNIFVEETAYQSMDLSVSALRGERSKISSLGQHARKQNLLTNCRKALEASRGVGVYVVHIRHAFRRATKE